MGEENNKHANLLKTLIVVVAVITVLTLLGFQFSNLFSSLPILLIIGGLPALGILFIATGAHYKRKGEKKGKVLIAIGVLALVAYGACWGVLFFGLKGV